LTNEIDYKIPVGISLPQSMIKEIDEKRGRLGRSTYILLLLEKALKRRKTKVA
jgi:metal-responsive CopG/Arc/MetJ family transcriptional regulator